MSCVTFCNTVGSDISRTVMMPAGVTEDDEISDIGASSFLPTYEDTQRQFILLTSTDRATRETALDTLREQIWSLVEFLTQKNGISLENADHASNGPQKSCVSPASNSRNPSGDLSTSFGTPKQVLNHLLGSFLRLSMWCPYEDVRVGCKETLMYLKQNGINVPKALVKEPSSFIPHSHIPPVDTDDEEISSLYVESYAQTCRLEHMVLVMGMHPQYLKEFLAVNMHLLKSDGALPYCYRSYIGILAAARHKCKYLVRLMETDFLVAGGDPQWLCGIKHACPKLRALSDLNKLLAHRPWLVNETHIERLCKGGNGWQWSQSELVQAVILLCHFHSLSIFCHGTGVNLELDHVKSFDSYDCAISPNGNRSPPSFDLDGDNSSNDGNELGNDNDIEALMQKMRQIDENDSEIMTKEELSRLFESQKLEAYSHNLEENLNDNNKTDKSYCLKYIDDAEFSYEEFAKRSDSNEIPTFKAMDFNWQDHAYSLVNTYYHPVGDMLDSKFHTAYNMTYNTLATKEHVDTSKLRRAIWMYIHCTCGIMFDDYNYGEVNELLERSLKNFIKTASCYPECTTKQIYDEFWRHFRHSEKVHVNIVLLEGRFQVELLYALRAVTEYRK